jgi:hypothetical protein
LRAITCTNVAVGRLWKPCLTTSTSAAELSITANAPARTLTVRWRTSEDDERDAERAEEERLREEGKTVICIGWVDPAGGKLIEHEPDSHNVDKGRDPV